MQKKPAEKAAEVVKAAETKATVKVAETKAVVKEAEKKVAETAQKVEEKAAEVAAKVEEKKAPVKKAVAAKKPAAKKPAAKKEELVPEVYIQYQEHEDVVQGVIDRAKAAYVEDGHKASAIKTLQVYLKPEENAAYYVVNQKYAGKVYLF